MNQAGDRPRPVFTPLQGQYLAFIHAYTLVNGQPPAEHEMMRFFQVTPPTVHRMVVTLEQAGLISRQPGRPRTIAVRVHEEGLPRLKPGFGQTVKTTVTRYYNADLDENGQVDFKGKAKAFARTYAFISAVLPFTNAEWEKLSIFLNFLIPKLPAPRDEDLSKGILEAIDMDSYRVEKQAAQRVQLTDQDAEIDPVPTDGGGHKADAELDRLSNIIRSFNDLFGNITWLDADHIRQLIATDIPNKVAANAAYQNAKQNSDKQNARIEHDKALGNVIIGLMKDDTELFKQFSDNPEFKRWLADMIFTATYGQPTPVSPQSVETHA